jgi:hypothetical protein
VKRLVIVGVAAAILAVAFWSADVARAVTIGWAQFLRRVVPRITWEPKAIGLTVATFLLFTLGVHWLGRSWLRGRGSERRWRFGWSLGVSASVIVVFTAGICMIGVTHQSGWLMSSTEPLIVASEKPRWSLTCPQTSLKEIAYGVLNYQDAYAGRPNPKQGVTSEGELLHGWIVHALPYTYAGHVTTPIDFTLPWNNPRNQVYFKGVLGEFVNDSLRIAPVRNADGYGLSHYSANCRAMADGAFRPFKEFTDGTANTLLVGEVNANFRPWGDPANVRDPARGVNRSAYGFGGPLGSAGALFAMADGSVRFVSERVSPAVLKALATPDGSETVDPSVLQSP